MIIKEKYIKKLVLLLVFVFLCTVSLFPLFLSSIYADEIRTGSEGFSPIIYLGDKIVLNTNNIYYANEEVMIAMPKGEDIEKNTSEVFEILDKTMAELNEVYGQKEIVRNLDSFYEMSVYEGGEFSEYEEINETLFLKPSENGNSNRHVMKFKGLLSYKFSVDDEVIKVVDITLKSDVYQFVFDYESPIISINGNTTGDIFINEGRVATVKITDNEGLNNVIFTRNGVPFDDISLAGDNRVISYEYDISLISDSDDEKVSIFAYDLSGNVTTYSFSYKVDDKPPVITYKNVEFGKIYIDEANINICAEDNSEKVSLFYKCIYTGENGESYCLEDKTYEDNGKCEINRDYKDDGIYDIVSFAYDDMGNYSNTIRLSFAVDKNAPVVAIENIADGGVYNSPVCAFANVKEMFYEGMSVEFGGTISDAEGLRKLSLPAYEIGSKSNKNIYTFSEEGEYNIALKATDSSMHSSTAKKSFTVDRSEPSVVVKIDNDKLDDVVINSESIASVRTEILSKIPEIKIETFDYLSEYSVTAGLYKKEKDGSYKEINISNIVSVGKNASFPMSVPSEGEFLLKVIASDAAGNISDKSYCFIVDENPPVIGYVSDFNQKYLKSFNLPKGFESYINDMTNVKYRAYLNSKKIDNCDISKDGKYLLQIVAEDQAGNKSESMTAFIVDNTMPKIIVGGLNDEGNIVKDGEIKLTLFDQEDYFKEVKVNGEKVNINDNKEITVKASDYGNYDISVVASDYAGNVVTQEVKTSCAMAANPFTVAITKDDIKTLTKNEEEIRESFFDRINGVRFYVFCVVLFMTAFGIIGFSLFDMKRI